MRRWLIAVLGVAVAVTMLAGRMIIAESGQPAPWPRST